MSWWQNELVSKGSVPSWSKTHCKYFTRHIAFDGSKRGLLEARRSINVLFWKTMQNHHRNLVISSLSSFLPLCLCGYLLLFFIFDFYFAIMILSINMYTRFFYVCGTMYNILFSEIFSHNCFFRVCEIIISNDEYIQLFNMIKTRW